MLSNGVFSVLSFIVSLKYPEVRDQIKRILLIVDGKLSSPYSSFNTIIQLIEGLRLKETNDLDHNILVYRYSCHLLILQIPTAPERRETNMKQFHRALLISYARLNPTAQKNWVQIT